MDPQIQTDRSSFAVGFKRLIMHRLLIFIFGLGCEEHIADNERFFKENLTKYTDFSFKCAVPNGVGIFGTVLRATRIPVFDGTNKSVHSVIATADAYMIKYRGYPCEVVICGHSYGGLVANQVAEEYARRGKPQWGLSIAGFGSTYVSKLKTTLFPFVNFMYSGDVAMFVSKLTLPAGFGKGAGAAMERDPKIRSLVWLNLSAFLLRSDRFRFSKRFDIHNQYIDFILGFLESKNRRPRNADVMDAHTHPVPIPYIRTPSSTFPVDTPIMRYGKYVALDGAYLIPQLNAARDNETIRNMNLNSGLAAHQPQERAVAASLARTQLRNAKTSIPRQLKRTTNSSNTTVTTRNAIGNYARIDVNRPRERTTGSQVDKKHMNAHVSRTGPHTKNVDKNRTPRKTRASSHLPALASTPRLPLPLLPVPLPFTRP